ncbi:methylamine dehydrogenase accessory protein MauD [Stutzerimonas kirkiae]|uniref:Methylamine utilization protein MauD n=1 Tax=Stutzerimonas kirkiae TaxID=2211392 RepID=A0A4Q9R2C4_9GAMM|nr:methylamine dehydrogenase accessory protein MauD [Stutzerimonas kirkiae]TBU93336.1 methylamine dehydrogenase accessory protein MauD [Stutzerimonas kirkiae]TBV01470.1 methylamine dehydrogenase accessory protein MauD [Stutzerimonas kirkiae]TBV06906.1 methylamine dehydrogenase accessory protein MauD [Stutzerimonas kirkiae]TBV10407.1 methylamine dehydrogenase accessory protein MauD [Stutzerimonas kirkiae]
MTHALVFAVAVLTVLVLGLIVVVFALARQIGILFERVTPVGAMINDSGPKVGETSPAFTLQSLNGGNDVAFGMQRPRSTLVFFLSPTCPICKKLLPTLKSIRSAEGNWLDVVLASDGDPLKHRAFIEQAGLAEFPYVLSQELGTTYRIARLPFAVLMDADGIVRAKGLINSREQLESLFNATETGFASIQDYVARATPASLKSH